MSRAAAAASALWRSWKVRTSLALVLLSLALFWAHAALFRDVKTLSFYLALDVVFVPVQVLLVSLIIERLLAERERQSMLQKLNMVVGAFFGEVGSELLRLLDRRCLDAGELAERLRLDADWKRPEFKEAARFASARNWRFARDRAWLDDVRRLLLARRPFVLSLLQNPNLFEHDTFTDMLWAVCHLTEELEARLEGIPLPETDLDHLAGDVNRAFGMLLREWLGYMRHLRESYPYMYSLAVRTNPFCPEASPIVR